MGDEDDVVEVVIEIPRGSRDKYELDHQRLAQAARAGTERGEEEVAR